MSVAPTSMETHADRRAASMGGFSLRIHTWAIVLCLGEQSKQKDPPAVDHHHLTWKAVETSTFSNSRHQHNGLLFGTSVPNPRLCASMCVFVLRACVLCSPGHICIHLNANAKRGWAYSTTRRRSLLHSRFPQGGIRGCSSVRA